MTDIRIEYTQPVYQHERVQQPFPVYRLQTGDERWYVTDNAGKLQFYWSVTTMIRAFHPTPSFVLQKIGEMGYERWQRYLNLKAARGTLFHILAAEFLKKGELNLSTVENSVIQYALEQGIAAEEVGDWTWFLKKSLCSFARFVSDVALEPLAVEMVLVSHEGYAGALDLVAEIRSRNGTRVRALIDLKSGSIVNEHRLQLYAYRQLWNANFPEQPVAVLYNWAPKNWLLEKEKMSYELRCQSGATHEEDVEMGTAVGLMAALYKRMHPTQPRGYSAINGTIVCGKAPESICQWYSASEIARQHINTIRIQKTAQQHVTAQ